MMYYLSKKLTRTFIPTGRERVFRQRIISAFIFKSNLMKFYLISFNAKENLFRILKMSDTTKVAEIFIFKHPQKGIPTNVNQIISS